MIISLCVNKGLTKLLLEFDGNRDLNSTASKPTSTKKLSTSQAIDG